jgi:hypothetical protein
MVLVFGLVLSVGTAWAEHRLIRVYVGPDENAAGLAAMDLDVASVVSGSHVDVIVDDGELHRISLKGFKTEMLIEDVESHMASILGDDMGDYHTYSEATEEMHAVAELYPDIARVDSIGRSYQNRAIWAIKISDYPQIHDPMESDVMFVGMHHAREIATPEVCLYLMNHLVDNYGIDPRITRLVNEREIWIIPILNPDGHVYVESGNVLWRKNRRPSQAGSCIGVDPNRNYGFMWGIDDIGSTGNPCGQTYRGTGPFSEYETRAIRDLVMSGKHDFTIGLSYHSYGRLILYPWGYTDEPTPDAATFAALADSMAAFNDYRAGPSYSAIYPTNGDFDDWMYGDMVISLRAGGKDPGPPVPKDRILSFTFEVGGGFGPPESFIPAIVEENLEPNLIAIEYADNPYRVWPPDMPVMEAPVALDNGAWELRWRTPNPEPPNLPVAFEVERAVGPSLQLDDLESGLKFWEGTGFEVSQEKSHGGLNSIRAGHKQDTRSSIIPVYPLQPTYGDSLTFWCWYGLVSGHAFFIEVSEDGGKNYSLLSGHLTGPDGERRYNGGYITGSSGGWERGAFPLDRYAGVEIVCRLRCLTGSAEPKEGIFLDDVGPVITYRERATVAQDLPSGRFTPVPSRDEPFLFRARAVDADGHRSLWSSAVSIPASQAPISRVLAAPNPFATVTKVSFAPGDGLSDAGLVPVKLQVFDAAGRLVRTLLQGEVPADRFHEKAWDRTTDNGDLVPSGLYFVVMTTRGQRSAEKVVLISGP